MAPTDRISVTKNHIAPAQTASSPALQYTAESDVFTPEERAFYEKNGYIIKKGCLTLEECERYKSRFVQLANKEVESPPFMTVMRDVSIASQKGAKGESFITKVQHFEDDEVLFEYCKNPNILRYVNAIVGKDVKSMHTMLINKPPHAGATGRHPLHQDLHYFPFRPANQICCAWTALERVWPGNGCLVVQPGTHTGELLAHEYPDWEGGANAYYHGIKNLDKGAIQKNVYVEMEAGDTVFFHPILIHGSGANKTQGYRKAISCHYASTHCHYIDVTGSTQEELAKEIKDTLKKKTGMDVEYTELWKFKSRLVSGQEDLL